MKKGDKIRSNGSTPFVDEALYHQSLKGQTLTVFFADGGNVKVLEMMQNYPLHTFVESAFDVVDITESKLDTYLRKDLEEREKICREVVKAAGVFKKYRICTKDNAYYYKMGYANRVYELSALCNLLAPDKSKQVRQLQATIATAQSELDALVGNGITNIVKVDIKL